MVFTGLNTAVEHTLPINDFKSPAVAAPTVGRKNPAARRRISPRASGRYLPLADKLLVAIRVLMSSSARNSRSMEYRDPVSSKKT